MWCYVHVVLHSCGAMGMWCYVHVVLCSCGAMGIWCYAYAVMLWCCVYVELWLCGTVGVLGGMCCGGVTSMGWMRWTANMQVWIALLELSILAKALVILGLVQTCREVHQCHLYTDYNWETRPGTRLTLSFYRDVALTSLCPILIMLKTKWSKNIYSLSIPFDWLDSDFYPNISHILKSVE